MGVSHFKRIYYEPTTVDIVEIIRLASYFLRFIDEQSNEELMCVINKDELKSVVGSFDKNPSPNGW
jgi:hypothetical protein